MAILRQFRALVEAIEALAGSIVELAKCQREAGPPIERLERLELSRAQFEAEMQGMLLKADGKLKAAANAEARERQLKKSYERDVLDPLDPDSEGATEGPVLPVHAQAGEAQGVPPVHLALARNDKTAAVRAKFGIV